MILNLSHVIITDHFILRMILVQIYKRRPFKSHTPASKAYRPKKINGNLTIIFNDHSFFKILFFQCVHRQSEASIFVGISALKCV